MALPNVDLTPEPWVPEDTFGSRLALIRNRMGWNVKEAADACGFNDQTWRNWEGGTLPRDLVGIARQIAKITGCHERWLVLGAQNWKKNTTPDLRLVHTASTVTAQATRPVLARLRLVGSSER